MGNKGRILVIDDDEAVRLRVRDLLERSDTFTVDEASDGFAGLEAVQRHPPDLILLDIMMPGMTGLEVCARLRADAQSREIPIIIMSAADESEAMIKALDAGAEDYLPKPVSAAELRAKARTITRLNRYRSLLQERRRLEWIVERSSEAILAVDAEGRQIFANASARTLFGLGTQPGGDVILAVSRAYRAEPAEAWDQLRAGGFRPVEPFAVVRPECSFLAARWLQVDTFSDPDGGEGTLLITFTDRSGSVRRELETWTFQHLISHKIRTPLNGISSVIEVVAASDAIQADPDSAALLELARGSALRLEETLLGVLRYHEAMTSVPGRRRPGPLRTLCQAMATAVADAGLPVEKIRWRLADDGMLERPYFDEAGQIVLTEVIGNYVKFSEAATAGLSVDVWLNQGSLSLRFTAPGPRILPEAVAQLGRAYWQLEGRFSGEIPGIGLGLATARLLARSLGGDLRFAPSEDPVGLATTFELSLRAPTPESVPS
ncbi:MAG TPA: response regulator [Opitutaceae bacterium]|nr:response regulator [Opitutaceae bacterium]